MRSTNHMNVITRETRLIQVNGSYFNTPVVFPYPRNRYFETGDVAGMCENVFSRVTNRLTEEAPTGSVPLPETINMVREVVKSELLSVYELPAVDESGPENVEETIDDILAYVFPDVEERSQTPVTINTHGDVIHITRVLLQTVLDNLCRYVIRKTDSMLGGDETTHMSVENPLEIQDCKWDEVKTNCTLDNVSYECHERLGIRLWGDLFTDPIFMASPDNEYMTHNHAASAAKALFYSVTEKYGIGNEKPFTAVPTDDFLVELQETVTRKLTKNCNVISSNAKSVIRSKTDSIIPDPDEYTKIPSTIRCEDIIPHLTRIILQTIFDQLSDTQTHMTVENTLHVTEHKWSETRHQ